MSILKETAYPTLDSEVSEKELVDCYTPSEEEYGLLPSGKKPVPRIGFLLHLKLFQRLGRFVQLQSVPQPIIEHLVSSGGFQKKPTKRQLTEYDNSGAKFRHQDAIRKHLNVRVLTKQDQPWLDSVAESAAETKEVLPDIVNVMLEELIRHRFELPGFSGLLRSARKARNRVNDCCFQSISSQLTKDAKRRIDELLSARTQQSYSAWQMLKREPQEPTNKNVRSFLQHIQWLQSLGAEMPIIDLPAVKLKQFQLEAQALDVAEISALKTNKRYALAVILIHSQHGKALDDTVDVFKRIVRTIDNAARAKLQAHFLEQQKTVDSLIVRFKDVLNAYQSNGTSRQRFDRVENVLGNDTEALIDQCDEHIAYADNNYLPFMLGPYRSKRQILFNCINILDLRSTSNDNTTETLLKLIKPLQHNRYEHLKPEFILKKTGINFDPQWLPEKWKNMVLVREKHSHGFEAINRKYLELWIFRHVQQELLSGDLYVPHSEHYNDYREQLIDDLTLSEELEDFSEQVELPLNDGREFVQFLKLWHSDECRRIDHDFPKNTSAEIVDGRLILRQKKKKLPSEAIERVDELITRRMKNTSIIDLLTDTEKWTQLHNGFYPLSGNQSKIEELGKRFITTLFCYGCNLGPTQTQRSVKNFTRRQVAWLNLKHVTEARLENANTKVVNTYKKFDLPTYWGTGKSASADGTKWELYEQNLLSEYHIRYGGYGGIGYYHVSDTYIALFSHFIPCGVYEAVYILDGLMKNQSDIQPDTLHGDTQAQSYPVFALSYLLGINLMPRIRNIHDLNLYRPDNRYRYRNIDSLFNGGIDFKVIETHLKDMLRVAISIKLGKISPSAILRRLGTYSRKNKLYIAFKELGKVVRTVFLLKYISEVELRQTINAATVKSEEFNNFSQWLFFGGDGVIAENLRHQQRKIVKYNNLVANLVILYNAEKMTRILAKLRDEGEDITPEILAGLSPYRTSHINRFGDYTLDLSRNVEPLDFNLKVID